MSEPLHQSLPTPFYDDGQVVIYHGDNAEILPALEPVDLIVTSPPYNMGLVPGGNGRGMYRPGASNKAGRFRDGYGAHGDALPQDEYDAWQRDILRLCWDRLTETGAIFYNHRPRVEHGVIRLPLGFDFGLPVRQVITWDRGTGIDVSLRQFCTVGEWIVVLAKPEFRLVDHSASGMGDVWRLGMETRVDHPAPFPVSLPTKALLATGARTVLDPFMGSGSTLRAAKDLGRRAVG
ncbi:MAG TPA: site-specific DNA-methyltransferase, partial [Solirubrobacteraceae bacterium]|nr:site-specific DNA-methyltransferase [Solirubrobacteraceae bacterium]